MKFICFFACVVLLARASPTIDGMLPSESWFSFDFVWFILLHALIIRPLSDHQFDTFDDLFMPEAGDALYEPPSHSSWDLFSPSNDLHHLPETFKHKWEPVDSGIIEKSNNELLTRNSFLNESEHDEREFSDSFLMNEPVGDQVAHFDQHLGAGPISHHDDVEPNVDNEEDSGMQEKSSAKC